MQRKLTLEEFLEIRPSSYVFKADVADALRVVFPRGEGIERKNVLWKDEVRPFLKQFGFELPESFETNFGYKNPRNEKDRKGKPEQYAAIWFWMYAISGNDQQAIDLRRQSDLLCEKYFGCSAEDYYVKEHGDLPSLTTSVEENDQGCLGLDSDITPKSADENAHRSDPENGLVKSRPHRPQADSHYLYVLAIVAVFGIAATTLAFMFSSKTLPASGQLTLNIKTVDSDAKESLSFIAPNQLLLSEDRLIINTNLAGTKNFHAMGLYRVVSQVGDSELVQAFGVGDGAATTSKMLRAADLISGQTDYFAVSVLGCDIEECTDPIGLFPVGERFDRGLPKIPVGQAVDLQEYPVFLVPLNVQRGIVK